MRMFKRVLLGAVSVFLLLTVVLVVHIYIVTRPKAPDAHTRIMARIDIKQPINQDDANKITTWLYQQKGIDHVMCNPKTEIVVFTFFPIKTNGNQVVNDFKSNFNYNKAQRYIPTEAELKGGCPAASTSFAYKTYNFFKNIF
jgi:hypothetical protein